MLNQSDHKDKDFNIAHIGLKKAKHEFDFVLDKAFFGKYPDAMIDDCNLNCKVVFDKASTPNQISFDISGTVQLECDRCTANFPLPIDEYFVLYIKYISDFDEEDENEDEILYVNHNQESIDVAPLLAEFAQLSIPIHKICDKSGAYDYCNKDILKYINHEVDDTTTNEPIKEKNIWDDLKQLKDKLN